MLLDTMLYLTTIKNNTRLESLVFHFIYLFIYLFIFYFFFYFFFFFFGGGVGGFSPVGLNLILLLAE